jgi:hypothetical protein
MTDDAYMYTRQRLGAGTRFLITKFLTHKVPNGPRSNRMERILTEWTAF